MGGGGGDQDQVNHYHCICDNCDGELFYHYPHHHHHHHHHPHHHDCQCFRKKFSSSFSTATTTTTSSSLFWWWWCSWILLSLSSSTMMIQSTSPLTKTIITFLLLIIFFTSILSYQKHRKQQQQQQCNVSFKMIQKSSSSSSSLLPLPLPSSSRPPQPLSTLPSQQQSYHHHRHCRHHCHSSSIFFIFNFCRRRHIMLMAMLSMLMMIPTMVHSVTVTEVHIMSINTGRTDYVIQGESVQLSCHYIFNKPYERVVAVNWQKDGQDVYFSTPNKRPLALSLFRGHVDYNSKDLLNTVTLFNIDMHFAGQYSCRVITEYNESENTVPMIVIVDACRDVNWRTRTDMVNCVEEISFHCVGMYPKPSPACSIHNDKTDQYYAGETFDMIERLPNGTYEIAIQRRYKAENFTAFPGELSFHCQLLVLMTTWRMGIKYKLFGESGCVQPPPTINNGSYVILGEKTCWGTPRESSRANYTCAEGYELIGPPMLICRNGTWIPDPVSLMTQPVADLRALNLRKPYCNIQSCCNALGNYAASSATTTTTTNVTSSTINFIIILTIIIISSPTV